MKPNLSESLLSEPGKEELLSKFCRQTGPAITDSGEFSLAKMAVPGAPKPLPGAGGITRQFALQYAHSYAVRLWAIRPGLEAQVKGEWGQAVEIKKIAELCQSSSGSHPQLPKQSGISGNSPVKKMRNSNDHEQHIAMREDLIVVVIGTIFKQQPDKPSILQELVEDNPMVPVVPRTRYISDKDVILMEDETARVQLVPSEGCGMTIDGVVNGVVCAVKGRPTINGKFEIDDVLFATPKPSPWPEVRSTGVEMIFISGLHVDQDKNHCGELELLLDYLQGLTGCPEEYESSLKEKTKLFILGDSFGKIDSENLAEKTKSTLEIAKRLDDILDQLSQTMEVFIIPGHTDPSEPMFPQTPIHRCILPKSSRRKTFHALSNPCRLQLPVEKKKCLDIILTSGYNVKDAMRNTDIKCSIEMAQKLLQWGHLCPTAPDTLPLHPGIQDDIFVLKTLPNFFIIGNCDSYGVREWKGTRIVTVPKFSASGSAVIVQTDLNVVPLNIKVAI